MAAEIVKPSLNGDDAKAILGIAWRWIADANDGVGGDVGDLLYGLEEAGYGPERAGLALEGESDGREASFLDGY